MDAARQASAVFKDTDRPMNHHLQRIRTLPKKKHYETLIYFPKSAIFLEKTLCNPEKVGNVPLAG
jgi:hypothetical protein